MRNIFIKIFYLGTTLCQVTLPLIVFTVYITVFCHELWSKQEHHYVHQKTQLPN